MNIQEQLKEIGLFESEIKVYLYLLENGLSTPPQIAKGTKIARPNCYQVLRSLKERGLIGEQKKGSRKVYIASDPVTLVESMERKREAMQRLLPDLRALYTVQKNKPKIRFFEGFEGIKQMFEEMLETTDRVYGFASTKRLFEIDTNRYFYSWRKRAKKKGIMLYDILSHDSGNEAMQIAREDLKPLFDARTLPKDYGDLPTDILIWGDNVALTKTSDPVFATVISDPDMAQTFKNWHRLAWERLS